MLFIQLFAPAAALVLGVVAITILVARLRPAAALAAWSWLRVILTPSGHAFVLPRFETAHGAVEARRPQG